MKRNIWNVWIVACSMLLTAACTDNLTDLAPDTTGGEGMERADVVLRCKAQLPSDGEEAADTRAVTRTEQEGRVSSALFIFMNPDSVCVGATHLDTLKTNLSAGQLPLSTTGLQLAQGTTYRVYAVLNYTTYLANTLTPEIFALSFVNLSTTEVRKMLSSGVDAGRDITSAVTYNIASKPAQGNDPATEPSELLFSSEFDFTFGQNTAYCEFHCLSTRFVLDFTRFPAHHTLSTVTIENLPLATPWFDTDVSWETPRMLPPVTFNIDPDAPTVSFYSLSNLSVPDKQYALKLTLKGTKVEKILTDKNTNKEYWGIDLTNTQQVDYQEVVSVLYSTDNYRFRPNQYVDIHFFEAVDSPGKLDYTVSSWPSASTDASSRLMKYDSENNMISVSLSSIALDYASQHDAPYFLEGFPDGSVSKEVFLSYTGFSPSWEVTTTASWLTVEKSAYNNSFILTADPNFTVTSDGGLRSAARQAQVQLTVYLGDGQQWKPTITVTQQSAPSFPDDVDLGPITVRGANAHMESKNFYWVSQDGTIKGSSQVDAAMRTWYTSSLTDVRKVRMLIGNNQPNQDKLSQLNEMTGLCPQGYEIPTFDDMYNHLLPRLRRSVMQIAGEEVTVYYIPGNGSLCFLPLVGSMTLVPSAKYMLNASGVPGYTSSPTDQRNRYCSGFELSTHSMIVSSGSMRPGNPTGPTWGDVRCIKKP